MVLMIEVGVHEAHHRDYLIHRGSDQLSSPVTKKKVVVPKYFCSSNATTTPRAIECSSQHGEYKKPTETMPAHLTNTTIQTSPTTTQQKLKELEKTAAPFHEQLVIASKYIGLEISSLENPKTSNDHASKLFHGKEEWVLRWLLKRLHGEKGKR